VHLAAIVVKTGPRTQTVNLHTEDDKHHLLDWVLDENNRHMVLGIKNTKTEKIDEHGISRTIVTTDLWVTELTKRDFDECKPC